MRFVARINVTPLKGTRLLHPERVALTERGIPDNRRCFLIDQRGALFSGSDFGPLVRVRAEASRGGLRCSFPDGTEVEVSTIDLGEPIVTDFYGRPVPGHLLEGGLADVFSEYVGRPVRVVRADDDGDGPDVHRLTLVSSASVGDLGRRGHEPGLDARRFRINLELDGCDPYEEDSWDGSIVEVGSAAVRIHGQIPRCVVTTQSPDTGLKDFDTLKRIAAYRPFIDGRRGIPFGVYAEVERPGEVGVGDVVRPD